MDTITFDVVGTYGIIMHNALGMARTDPNAATKKRIPTPEEEAEASAYRLSNDVLYMPADAFRSALIDGATGLRIGTRGLPKIISTTTFVVPGHEYCMLADPETGEMLTTYEIDTRRVVIQGNGIMRSRALVPRWATQVTLEFDTSSVKESLLLQVMNLAGHRVGVGDYRPRPPIWAKGKGGPYGRFEASIAYTEIGGLRLEPKAA